MMLPNGTFVAVADGEKLHLFHNVGDEASMQLVALPQVDVESANKGAGALHQSSSANPDDSQQAEDNFSAGVADTLNRQVLDGKIKSLVVVAAPRTLGELRKQYHKMLSAVLIGELDKDLTGHSIEDIEKAIHAI